MKLKNTITLLVCLALFCGIAIAEEKKMETTVSAGLTFTEGNSDTLQGNAGITTEGEKESLGSFRVGAEANYGEVNDEKNVDNLKGFVNAKKTLSEKTFAYIDGSAVKDDIAFIDYRATIGPGLGVFLVKNDTIKFCLEGGIAYIWEEVGSMEDDYAALRIAERLDYQISKTAKLWQSAEYIPQTDEPDNYLVNAEIGIEAALNSHLNLRVLVQNKYDNEPAAGLEKSDTTVISGISMKL